jgi:hypothetical protein
MPRRPETWYIASVDCKCGTRRIARLNNIRKSKHVRCKCKKHIKFSLLGTVRADNEEEALKAEIVKKPNRRWHRSTEGQRKIAEMGLEWLESERLQIILIPAPEPKHHGHMIRVVAERNPAWYSRIAHAHGILDKKKSCGPIRQQVRRALLRMINGWYDPIGLEDEILEELTIDLKEMEWL